MNTILTDAMIDAANRTCRNDERCGNNWEPSKCQSCRQETAEDLKAAMAAAAPEAPAQISSHEWVPCVKLPVTVHVRQQRPGETHVSTREGLTPVKQDDLIMRGVSGEEYPIGREIFNATYRIGEAPALPADVREALKVAREALWVLVENGGIGPESMFHDARAALARIDALGGVE